MTELHELRTQVRKGSEGEDKSLLEVEDIKHEEEGSASRDRDSPRPDKAIRLGNGTEDMSGAHSNATQNAAATFNVKIDRPVYNQLTLDATFGNTPRPESSFKRKLLNRGKKTCTKGYWVKKMCGLFPFIDTLRTYKVKEYLLADTVAGVSVSVVHIPQSMGFALLASLPPVYGLHASFWQPLIYFFLAISYHNSFGTMAVISLLLGSTVDREILNFPPSLTTNNVTGNGTDDVMLQEMIGQQKVAIATVVTLLAGLIQIAMGMFRLGIVTTFMPVSFVSSFTCGCGFHIVSSQLQHVFGVKVVKFDGLWRLILGWVDVASKLPHTNIAALVISIISIAFLFFIKEYINVRFKHRLLFPIPAEIIVVILGTLCSYLGHFDSRWSIQILGEIKKGIPAPQVPPMAVASNVIKDSVLCAVLSFVISISMANVFSGKYKYEVDSNQELFAYGASNSISSFFHSFAGAVAPPRNFVYESAGGKTRVAHLISCVVLFLVIMVIAPLLEYMPKAVLGSIVIVAISPLFKQFKDMVYYWKVSKLDCSIWIVTLIFTAFADVAYGLIVGLLYIFIVTTVQTLFVKGNAMGIAGTPDVIVPFENYSNAKVENGICIFSFPCSLYYATVGNFKKQLFLATLDPYCKVRRDETKNDQENGQEEWEEDDKIHTSLMDVSKTTQSTDQSKQKNTIKTIIIDCSCFSFLDVMGLNTLRDLRNGYERAGVRMCLAQCVRSVQEKLAAAVLAGGEEAIPLYPTVHDAVFDALSNQHNHPPIQNDIA